MQKQAIFIALIKRSDSLQISRLLPKDLDDEDNFYKTLSKLCTLIIEPQSYYFIKKLTVYPFNLCDDDKQQLLKEINGDANAHPPIRGLLCQCLENTLNALDSMVKAEQVRLMRLFSPLQMREEVKSFSSKPPTTTANRQPTYIEEAINTFENLLPEILNHLFVEAALKRAHQPLLREYLKNENIFNKLNVQTLIKITTRLPDLYPILKIRIFSRDSNLATVDIESLIEFMLSHIGQFTEPQHQRLIKCLIPIIEKPLRELHILALSNEVFALLLIKQLEWEKAVIAPAELLQVLSKKYLSVENEIAKSEFLKKLLSQAKTLESPSLSEHFSPNLRLKIVVVGTSKSGKSSLLQAFSYNQYGAAQKMWVQTDINVDGCTVKAEIIEPGCAQSYQSSSFNSLNGAHLYLLTLDTRHPEGFKDLNKLFNEMTCRFHNSCKNSEHPPCILVGTKADKINSNSDPSPYTLEEIAHSLGWHYIETSANQGKNIQQTLQLSAKVALNAPH